VQSVITSYGYLAVFILMLAESACIPVPSEVIMMFGGALAGGAFAGAHPSLIGIIVAGVLGNVAGSYIAWAVGLYAGQPAVRRWGPRFGVREHEIDKAIGWFERRGPAAVLIGRVVPVVRTFISLPAGFAQMRAVPFGLYTLIGCIPWTAALGYAGYALGKNWASVANAFHGPTYVIAAIIVVAIAVALFVRFRKRRAADAREPGGYRDGEWTDDRRIDHRRMDDTRVDNPRVDHTRTDRTRIEHPRIEHPRTGQPPTDRPRRDYYRR
jgi:membrane protein DedA with SNARE-associated domain